MLGRGGAASLEEVSTSDADQIGHDRLELAAQDRLDQVIGQQALDTRLRADGDTHLDDASRVDLPQQDVGSIGLISWPEFLEDRLERLTHVVVSVSLVARSASQQLQSDAFRGEGQFRDPHPGRVVDRVGHGGRRRHDRRLADSACSEGSRR